MIFDKLCKRAGATKKTVMKKTDANFAEREGTKDLKATFGRSTDGTEPGFPTELQQSKPEQIEAEVIAAWKEQGEKGYGVEDASRHAQCLHSWRDHHLYFYISATNHYFMVCVEGNYYHGYDTTIHRLEKNQVISDFNDARRRAASRGDDCSYWDQKLSLLALLPAQNNE